MGVVHRLAGWGTRKDDCRCILATVMACRILMVERPCMRRGILLLATMALLGSTLPLGAQAVARSFPGALLGMVTRPIGAVLGNMGRVSRVGRSHRPVVRSET